MHEPPALARCALVLVVLLAPAAARAAFSVNAIELYQADTNKRLSTTDLTLYFNQAKCLCGTKMKVIVRLGLDTQASSSSYVEVVTGKNCLDVNQAIKTDCKELFPRTKVNTLTGDITVQVSAKDLMSSPTCTGQNADSYGVIVYTDDNGDGKWDEKLRSEYSVDTQAPNPPTSPSVLAGDTQVNVTFSAHSGGTTTKTTDSGTSVQDTNFKGYQVLCEKADGSPAFSSPPAAEYETSGSVCNGSSTADAGVSDAGAKDSGAKDLTHDAGPKDLGTAEVAASDSGARDAGPRDQGASPDSGSTTSGVGSLDTRYVCSAKVTSPGTVTVSGLQNGTTYRFYVITIDTLGNPSTLVPAGETSPVAATGLWEAYKAAGGKSDGGYCFVATAAYGSYDDPHVRILRAFRDEVLLSSRLGEAFVVGYYTVGQQPASWLARHPSARPFARAALWPLTLAAAAHLYTTPLQKGLVLLLAVGLAALVWRRRGSVAQAGGGR